MGPLDENEAITGAGFIPKNVFACDTLIVIPDFIVKPSNSKSLHLNIMCIYWSLPFENETTLKARVCVYIQEYGVMS